MSKIISIHSFRGGTGKSNTSANLATLLAMQGLRVGVVDTDIQSPGIHVLFNLEPTEMRHTLNDYLWGKCDIEEAVHDVTPKLGVPISGKVLLVPSSIRTSEISRVLREGYDPGLLNDGFQRLVEKARLDALIIDTHPGVGEETLLSIAISDALVVVMRPDQQDFQGTSVTVEIGRHLDVPRMVIVVNKMPNIFDERDVKKRVENSYGCEVAAVLPHSDEMMALASQGVFVARYPNHSLTERMRGVAKSVYGPTVRV
ncbi:MinD/ParA family ATP-binding protein [Deinococcus yavapaiensis]|uniref:MinD-like ATPase involved in chromosome partitioning or flagellar assembly n=1 Tax=Deinococcus yavapaiensis KR-236 TaxID=694435 RepID=A0A318SKA8_9DEIO|nr:MinD/ParA family protein [Deinococcus yavapaiensis]PYE54789.1 MinD-like ATPase involved in chromosome partitioning or flagellar assembly [Deinococcus yavapaiensis KR-236]